MVLTARLVQQKYLFADRLRRSWNPEVISGRLWCSSVLTHKKEQQIKIAGEFKPTVDCLCATRLRFVFIHKGMDATLAIKCEDGIEEWIQKKKCSTYTLSARSHWELTEVMKPLYTSSRSITRIKKTSNIMLPAKPMAMAAYDSKKYHPAGCVHR